MNLHIVIPLPKEVKKSLLRLCYGLPSIEWTEEENFHITLQSINQVEGTLLLDIKDCLNKVEFDPFFLTLKEIVPDPFKKGQGFLTIEMNPSDELKKLNVNLDRILKELKLPGKIAYKPHIKLGKYTLLASIKLIQYLEANASFLIPPIEVNSIQLLSSQKTPKHMIYRIEGQYPISRN